MDDPKNDRTAEQSTPRSSTHHACHDVKNFLIHLRLPYQLTLAPFMVWGAALAKAPVSMRFAVGFAVLHICFYGGTTAYNSHYDRDQGPVGGLAKPPPPGPWLLPGSLALQGLGLAIAAWVGWRFFAVCLVYGVLGVLYSNPRTRWKGKPLLSWAAVMFGQGVLGSAAGVVIDSDARVSPHVVWGLFAAAALVGALYPLTQLFQTEEDRARGDRTAAMMLGRRGTCTAAIVLSALGAACAAASAHAAGRAVDAWLLATAVVPMALGALWVCARADASTQYRRISRFQIGAGASFGVYAVLRLWHT